MVFCGFLLLRNYSVVMICSVLALLIIQEPVRWSRITQLYLLLPMGMYGFGIRPMDVVESSTRKTGKWYLLNLRRNVVICRITGYNLLMKMPGGEFGLERNVDWYLYLTVSIKWKIVCFILLLLWHLKIICIF